jgi:hypothetical protein
MMEYEEDDMQDDDEETQSFLAGGNADDDAAAAAAACGRGSSTSIKTTFSHITKNNKSFGSAILVLNLLGLFAIFGVLLATINGFRSVDAATAACSQTKSSLDEDSSSSSTSAAGSVPLDQQHQETLNDDDKPIVKKNGGAVEKKNRNSHPTEMNRYPDQYRFATKLAKDNNVTQPKVLSFGCSTGREAVTLALEYLPTAHIFGVDIDDETLSEAEEYASRIHQPPERPMTFFNGMERLLSKRMPPMTLYLPTRACAIIPSMNRIAAWTAQLSTAPSNDFRSSTQCKILKGPSIIWIWPYAWEDSWRLSMPITT